MLYLDTRELPKCIRVVLKKLGYFKREITVEYNDKVSLKNYSSLRYNRSFAAIVDLKTSKHVIGYGLAGGTNQFTTRIVDDCDHKFVFPSTYVVIKGESGDNGCYASLVVRTDCPITFQSSTEDWLDRIYKILKIYLRIQEPMRHVLLKGFKSLDIKDAMDNGLIALNSNRNILLQEVKITKKGKKFIARVENMFPEKMMEPNKSFVVIS